MTDDDSDGGSVPRSDVYASDIEGQRYRKTAYVPVPEQSLEEAPENPSYPKTGDDGRFRLVDLPKVPKLSHVVGPSAIMLGASLGSGETLFWPLLVGQSGWEVYWVFWVGVLTQFFINTEIQRWTMVTGESIFRSLARVHRYWPWVFLVGGFASLGWPGWAASAAKVGAQWSGFGAVSVGSFTLDGWRLLAVVLMGIVWTTYQLSPVMYNVVEKAQVLLLALSVAAAVFLVLLVNSLGQLQHLPAGAVSFGTLPADLDLTDPAMIATLLGGLAYAGAGGYLNLSQSLWAREKGFGMGTYQGRVKNPLIGDDHEPVERDGFVFRPDAMNLERWRGWWRVAQLEHLLTFVLGLLVVATVLMTVSAKYASGTDRTAVDMWLMQIAPAVSPLKGALIHLVLFLALFTTQYAIVESFVRNSAEIIYESYGRAAGWSLPRLFWGLLTLFVAWGMVIIALPIEQPFFLLIVAAAASGVMMWPYTALTLFINTARLPEHVQPGWVRVVAMWWATAFFGFFSVLAVGNTLASWVGLETFRTTLTVAGSAAGGYGLWSVFFLVQAATMYVSTREKLRSSGTVPGVERVRNLLH